MSNYPSKQITKKEHNKIMFTYILFYKTSIFKHGNYVFGINF